MPRVFLVKKSSISPRKRDWSLVPDSSRGDKYVPISLLPPYYGPEQPVTIADLPLESSTQCHLITQQTSYIHSKVKIIMGELPGDISNPSKSSILENKSLITLSCPTCQKTFSSTRMLKRHLKTHSDLKRYLCEYCEKGFNDAFDLKRHVRTHTGVRPFRCDMCDKAFTQRCSLESHLRKVHGVSHSYAYNQRRDKLYVCEDCGLTAKTREILRDHLQIQHLNSKKQNQRVN